MRIFSQKPIKLLRCKYLLNCLELATKEMELLGIFFFFGLRHAKKKITKILSVMNPSVCEPPKLWDKRNSLESFFNRMSYTLLTHFFLGALNAQVKILRLICPI